MRAARVSWVWVLAGATACGGGLEQAIAGTTGSDADASTTGSSSDPDADGGPGPAPTAGDATSTGSGGVADETSTGQGAEGPADSSTGEPPPACDDGVLNGRETGIDCGGACEACEIGQGCATHVDCVAGLHCDGRGSCAWPPDCATLLLAWPRTPSGGHPLDPDGDGQSENFACDMEYEGGGWTRVLFEDFAVSDASAWSDSDVTTCGAFGEMLGGYDTFSGVTVSRAVELFGIVHTAVRLQARYFKIDSWDNEDAFAEIDGDEVWTQQFSIGDGNGVCGDGLWDDLEVAVDVMVPHVEDTMTIAFGSELNEGPGNESWGVDDVEVWIR